MGDVSVTAPERAVLAGLVHRLREDNALAVHREPLLPHALIATPDPGVAMPLGRTLTTTEQVRAAARELSSS